MIAGAYQKEVTISREPLVLREGEEEPWASEKTLSLLVFRGFERLANPWNHRKKQVCREFVDD